MSLTKKILLGLGILIIMIISSGIVIAFFYEKEVKSYVIEQLNRQLNTKIEVEEIRFSLLKKFPYASVEFENISALDAIPNSFKKDTLFKAENIFLQFNIVDIWNKKYRIKKIEVNRGFANVKVYQNGSDNFHFWKPLADTASSNFDFALKEVVFKKFDVNYKNSPKNQKVAIKINYTNFSGNFTNEAYDLNVETKFFAGYVYLNETPYLKNQNVEIDALLKVVNTNNSIEVKKGDLSIADLKFSISGRAVTKPGILVDIAIHAKDMDIKSVLSLTPVKYKESLKDYESKGKFYFNASLKGKITDSENPLFIADFGIANAEIFHEDSHVKLENVNLNGKYTNGKQKNPESTILQIENFSCKMGSGKITADFSIQNFIHPQIKVSTVSDFQLAELLAFIKNDSIEHLEGKLNIDASFSGSIKNFKSYTIEDFKRSVTSGKMDFAGVNFKMKNNHINYSGLNGSFLFDNNDIIITQLAGNIMNNNFELKGFFRNVISYFFIEDQRLVVDASLKSDKLDLNELLLSESSSKSDTSYNMRFSKNANFYLNIELEKLLFRKFEAKNIHGKIVLKDEKLVMEGLSFNALEGLVKANGFIDAADSNNILVSCDAAIEKININKMFFQFENFGQNILQEKHIRGLATANIEFISEMDSKLNIRMDKLYTKASLDVEKGELINFEPMKNLSSFINISELEHIKFSNLKNEIEVRNSKLTIPKTEIASNALNLSFSGSHTFNHDIDYRIKVLLSDLLANKARKAKKENTEFGIEQPDDSRKMALFLKVYGTIDKPKFAYDKIALTEKVKEDIRIEKQNLKSILKEEFGLYKKDTAVKVPEKTVKQIKMQFEWEENKKNEDDAKPKNKFEKKEKSKFDKLLDKVAGSENKNEFEKDTFND